jgi:hypothetical protein
MYLFVYAFYAPRFLDRILRVRKRIAAELRCFRSLSDTLLILYVHRMNGAERFTSCVWDWIRSRSTYCKNYRMKTVSRTRQDVNDRVNIALIVSSKSLLL